MGIEVKVSVNYTSQLIDSNPEWISQTLLASNVKKIILFVCYIQNMTLFLATKYSLVRNLGFRGECTKKLEVTKV